MSLEGKLNRDYINISFDDTLSRTHKGRHLRIAKKHWLEYFGLRKLNGVHNHTIREDLDEFHEYITELDGNSPYAVRKQDEKNPAACIYHNGVLIGKIWDSRRRGYKELKYR